MGKKVPEPIEHMVAAIMKERGVPRERAYAIAVGRLQKLGHVKKGSLELTSKGKKALSKHYSEPKSERLKKVNMARKNKKKTL